MAVVLRINNTRIDKKEGNSAQLRHKLFYSFLFTILTQLIPNSTAIHPITYTYMMLFTQYLVLKLCIRLQYELFFNG